MAPGETGLAIRLGTIGRTYRHAQRYRQILAVLLKYGYGDLVRGLKLERFLRRGVRGRERSELLGLTPPQRIRQLLEELGPTFIKAGQLLSTRPDLLPVELLLELSQLQDSVPAFAFEQVQEIVERELKAPLGKLFDHFEPTPLAAASIGQVHRARTVRGEEVVVKVQRPQVRRTIEVDLEILAHLATLAERHVEGWEVHQPARVIRELAVSLEKELDYRQEAANQQHFAWQFAGDERVFVPRVHRSLTTAAVLVMELAVGTKATDLADLRRRGLDPRRLARLTARLTMEQLFVHGFFHGDPHPGNLLVSDAGVLCYLDFGLVGRIHREQRERFADLVVGLVSRDEELLAEALLGLCHNDSAVREDLERDLAEFTDRHFFQPLGELRLGEALQQLLEVVARHRLGIPADLFLMIKALANVEGLCRNLDPELEIAEEAAPFLQKVQAARVAPRRLAADLTGAGGELLGAARQIPTEARHILRQLRAGKARAALELLGLETLVATLDRASNRMAFAIVLAGLIIGSSVIVLAGTPPLFQGISLFGLAGFLVAAMMGFWLLVSILRHGRM